MGAGDIEYIEEGVFSPGVRARRILQYHRPRTRGGYDHIGAGGNRRVARIIVSPCSIGIRPGRRRCVINTVRRRRCGTDQRAVAIKLDRLDRAVGIEGCCTQRKNCPAREGGIVGRCRQRDLWREVPGCGWRPTNGFVDPDVALRKVLQGHEGAQIRNVFEFPEDAGADINIRHQTGRRRTTCNGPPDRAERNGGRNFPHITAAAPGHKHIPCLVKIKAVIAIHQKLTGGVNQR